MGEPCVKSDEIKGINDRLNRHSEKIDKISDNNLVLETILKRLEKDSEEQRKMNTELSTTLVSVQNTMMEISFNTKELNTKLMNVDEKIINVDKKLENTRTDLRFTNQRIEEVDDKTKIDVAVEQKSKIKENLPWVAFGSIGGIAVIFEVIKIAIETFGK